MASRQKTTQQKCLFKRGDRPGTHATPATLTAWAQAHIQDTAAVNDAHTLAQQLQLIGYRISRDSVQHQLDRQIRKRRQAKAKKATEEDDAQPTIGKTLPAAAPLTRAKPPRPAGTNEAIVRWLAGDVPASVTRNPGPFEVYRRARIRGYDRLSLQQITAVMTARDWQPFGWTPDPIWALRLLHRNDSPEQYQALLLMLVGSSQAEANGVRYALRQKRGCLWARDLLLLDDYPDILIQFLLLVLVAVPVGDPLVDPEDAPDFAIGSEWVDPQFPRTPDGRAVFIRVWHRSWAGVGLAYLAVSKGGSRVVDQGVFLTESMRDRLEARTRRRAA